MADVDWRSVRELMALRTRLKELVERAMLPDTSIVSGSAPPFECPVDVWESESEVVVEAELPGASADDVEARLEGDSLVLSGELPGPPEGSSSTFMRIERYRGPFRRVVHLPGEVAGQPVATLRSGVLQVRLPKQPSRRRRIAVERETP
jgi:HSP20 family protein